MKANKVFSILLVLGMLLGIFSIPVIAEENIKVILNALFSPASLISSCNFKSFVVPYKSLFFQENYKTINLIAYPSM
jgi:hypothetical protein